MKTRFFLLMIFFALFAMTGCSGEGADEVSVERHANEPSSLSASPAPVQPTQVEAATADLPETHTTLSLPDPAPVSQPPVEIQNVPEEDRIVFLEAINAARAQTQDCGSEGIFDSAPPMSWNDRLANAAYEHSYDMAHSETFSHDGSGTQSDETAQVLAKEEGSTFRERIEHQGYRQWRWIGENIAAGYDDPDAVVDAWIASPHHCANLMNPDFTEVGMARVDRDGSYYHTYWSQEFGAR